MDFRPFKQEIRVEPFFLEGGNGREYFLSDERECIWELTALMPVKKLGRYPIPSDMQNAHRPRKPYERAELSKNALDALA